MNEQVQHLLQQWHQLVDASNKDAQSALLARFEAILQFAIDSLLLHPDARRLDWNSWRSPLKEEQQEQEQQEQGQQPQLELRMIQLLRDLIQQLVRLNVPLQPTDRPVQTTCTEMIKRNMNRPKASTTTTSTSSVLTMIPTAFQAQFQAGFNQHREALRLQAEKASWSGSKPCAGVQLDEFQWRVNLLLSSSQLQSFAKASITMQMTTSDGRVRTFQVSQQQFHELRYAAAKLLQQSASLKAHPIMRLTNQQHPTERGGTCSRPVLKHTVSCPAK